MAVRDTAKWHFGGGTRTARRIGSRSVEHVVNLTSGELLSIRVRNQGLAVPSMDGVLDAVRRVGALQAQSTPAVRFAVRARTAGLTQTDVDDAIGIARSVVRTTLMRGTIHLVAADDLRWMTALLGPHVRAQSHRRREQLGLTDATCSTALDLFPRLLAHAGPTPLPRIVDILAQSGVVLDRTTQAPIHLMVVASTYGLVCRGPEAGRSPTFVLTDDWLPAGPVIDRDDALSQLAMRYLAGRGPATVGDFTTWSGLPAADCTTAFDNIADALVTVHAADRSMVALADDPLAPNETPTVRLLGMWDEYLLSHRSRDLILEAAVASQVLVGGVIQSTVVIDGRVAGVWRIIGSGRTRRLCVEAFSPFSDEVRAALDAEVADIGRFLDVGLRLDLTESSP